MPPPDHEKNALVQMVQEAMGREIQLRAALSNAQLQLVETHAKIARQETELNEVEDEVKRLTAERAAVKTPGTDKAADDPNAVLPGIRKAA